MNIHLKKFTDKVTAVILFIVITELAIGMALGISCMFDYHFYSSDRDTYAILETCRVKADDDIEELVEYCKLYTYDESGIALSRSEQNTLDKYKVKYAEGNTNVRFTAMCVGCDVVLTNKTSTETEEYIYEKYI